jgi:hypothetical protein
MIDWSSWREVAAGLAILAVAVPLLIYAASVVVGPEPRDPDDKGEAP